MIISKKKLINMATPDANIHDLQSSEPKLYRAFKNLGDAGRIIISTTFPPRPTIGFIERFVLPGNPSVANDVLDHRYHVAFPSDVQSLWNYTRIDLDSCIITAKVQGTASTLSIDIKVSQNKGRATFTSLFKSGLNPMLPKLTDFVNNAVFAIGSLYQDDLLRVDVLTTDTVVSGVELVLTGNYVIEETS